MSQAEVIWLSMPIWLIALIVYVGMMAAAYAGWRSHIRHLDHKHARAESEEGYVVSAVMGLLALLIGFTFALAVDRFDTRRQLVIDESNAIGTAYLRTQMLAEPHRSRIGAILVDYSENRLALAKSQIDEGQTDLLQRSDRLSADLWSATVAAFPRIEPTSFAGPFVSSVNELIDMDAARQQARRSHVPMTVLVLLVVYLFIAAAVIGYALVGMKGRVTAGVLLLLYGSSLVLVIDLDRPNKGGIRESQRPMELLVESMHANPVGSYDRYLSGNRASEASAP